LHAPATVQSVAPHAPPTDAQLMAQQWPVPEVPHTLAAHWAFALHAAPAPSFGTHAPPLQ
jgi:hypothetical protein